jgi:hypothetical protein
MKQLLLAALFLPALAGAQAPELPRSIPAASIPAPTGPVRSVAAGGDLQAALNAGGIIELACGATFTGSFILPARPGNRWTVVRPSCYASLPPAGIRMTPLLAAALRLPIIFSADAGYAISTALGAHHYALLGLELATGANLSQSYGLVGFGSDASQGQKTLADAPHDLILSQSYVHGTATMPLRRCIAINSATTAIVDSYISDCHDVGADAQAIASWNGPGPYLIQNNYLEASTENVLFGGSDAASAELSPADVTIRQNYISKPYAWKGGPWAIKTLLEFKNVKRVLVEGNVIEHNWPQAWDGTAITMKSVNQDGSAPWSGTTDVTMRNNWVRDVGSGMNLHGNPEDSKPTIHMSRVSITNNLMTGIASDSFPGKGNGFFLGGDLSDVTLDHNTLAWRGGQYTTAVSMEGDPPPPFHRLRITNNLFATVGGISLSGQRLGWPGDSFTGFAPDGTLVGNVFAVGTPYGTGQWNKWVTTMPAGNAIVVNDSASFPALHFALDYSLPAKSAFAGAGADVAAVYAAITGVVAGNGPLPPVIAPPVIVAPTLPPLVVVPVAPSDARAALKVIDAFLAYLRAQAALP